MRSRVVLSVILTATSGVAALQPDNVRSTQPASSGETIERCEYIDLVDNRFLVGEIRDVAGSSLFPIIDLLVVDLQGTGSRRVFGNCSRVSYREESFRRQSETEEQLHARYRNHLVLLKHSLQKHSRGLFMNSGEYTEPESAWLFDMESGKLWRASPEGYRVKNMHYTPHGIAMVLERIEAEDAEFQCGFAPDVYFYDVLKRNGHFVVKGRKL